MKSTRRVSAAIMLITAMAVPSAAAGQDNERATPHEPAGAPVPVKEPASSTKEAEEGAATKSDGEPKIPSRSSQAGLLMRYGFTVGAGFVIQAPAGDRLVDAAASPIGYIAVFPRWWFIEGDITKSFCAAKFRDDHAFDVANDLATTLAKQRHRKSHPAEKELPEVNDKFVEDETGWDRKREGHCGAYWLGVYGGLPASFTANSRVSVNESAKEFTPIASFGLAIAPFTYFSLLVGATVSNVKGDDGINHGLITPTVGVGLNADVFGELFGGK